MSARKDNELVISSDYLKNNLLIGAAYKSSLLENKIMAVALANVKDAMVEEDGTVVSIIRANDLVRLLNANRGSFYKQLEMTANSMRSHSIGMRDPEKGYFDYVTLITRTTYEDGDFRIEWNRHLKPYLKDISSNFTVLNIQTMLSFKSVYSFRLFELLKSQCYTSKYRHNTGGEYIIEYSLAELKLNLGVVNAEEIGVQKELKKKKTPDYDKAVNVAKDRLYETWKDFKKYVVSVACDEITEKTDMDISYEPIKEGRGAKVTSIIFRVRYKNTDNTENISKTQRSAKKQTKEGSAETDKFAVIAKVTRLIQEELPAADIVSICNAGNYDYEKISSVYALAKKAKNVKSLTGFMISGIRNNYSEPIVCNKKATDCKDYKKFEQRTYNFTELEKELLTT